MLAFINSTKDAKGQVIGRDHIVMKHPEAEAAGTWQIIGLARTSKGNFARIQHIVSERYEFVKTTRLERC